MNNRYTIVSSIVRMSIVILLVTVMSLPFSAMALTLSRELQIGMRGNDVMELQTFLASDSTLYPQGLVTGYYGSLTRAAVVRLQARHGLPQAGRVGPQTLALLRGMGELDGQAPVISNLQSSTGSTNATLSWNTNEGASALVYYNAGTITMSEGSALSDVTISGTSALVHTDMRTSHSVTLTNLMRNTTYTYVVYVRDASGNVTVTLPTTFTTTN